MLCRTNTYPKSQAPERYRLRSSDAAEYGGGSVDTTTVTKTRTASLHGSSTAPLLTKVSPNNHLSSANNNNNNNSNSNNSSSNIGKTNSNGKEQNKEEEVIYFWYKEVEI